jgi:hypothetical protein
MTIHSEFLLNMAMLGGGLTAGLANFAVKTVLLSMKCRISHDPIIVMAEMRSAVKPSQGMAKDLEDLSSSTGSALIGIKGSWRFLMLRLTLSVLGDVSSVVEAANWFFMAARSLCIEGHVKVVNGRRLTSS